jgi:hypothetical protein
MKQPETPNQKRSNRRSFLKNGMLAAGVATVGGGLMSNRVQSAFADSSKGPGITRGDVAILRWLATAELIETDLWIQYTELGGVTSGPQNTYQQAFQFLDGDGSQYIASNTLDEKSHATFIDAYLKSKGADPVNLDRFRVLPSSMATGAKQIGRLTNIMNLTVDTSWYTKYRSNTNPEFGATYPQALTIVDRPGIPRDDADFSDPDHIQAIANTAAFHFAFIEGGGSSLYATMAQKVTNLEVLKIVASIGGDEVAHFLEWVDFAGNSVQGPPYNFAGSNDPVTDDGLTFPNFNMPPFGTPLYQTNLIFPIPCDFISKSLPRCAVVRPALDSLSGALAAVKAFTADGLFIGQSNAFLQTIHEIAAEADAAQREL